MISETNGKGQKCLILTEWARVHEGSLGSEEVKL